MALLAGFLGLLEFLEFLSSPLGLTALSSLGLFWSSQWVGCDSAIAALFAGSLGLILYAEWVSEKQ